MNYRTNEQTKDRMTGSLNELQGENRTDEKTKDGMNESVNELQGENLRRSKRRKEETNQ